ncbi:MAG TPA: oxidoreductase [Bacteroidales bacterium]|nr:oxidoreductase [Bacteroidales bacterium]
MNGNNGSVWTDYALIDSGGFEKLERYGNYVLRRPEPQAVWPKRLAEKDWVNQAHAWFKRQKGASVGDTGERGEWLIKPDMPDRWTVRYTDLETPLIFRLSMTAFKHIGLFPEQVENWRFVYQRTRALHTAEPAVLNLFAYTGGASLAAAAAGAVVTHVDAVKPVITWARENAEASGLSTIRWMVEDALKFVLREVRRGKRYQGIILDPPAYGRGPTGEKWVLEAQINPLLEACAALLEPDGFVVLNLYSMGFSPIIAANLLQHYFRRSFSTIEYGELTVTDETGLILPLSVFARF